MDPFFCRRAFRDCAVYSCEFSQISNLAAAVSGGSLLAVEKMYISLIHSGDLLGCLPSWGLLLHPKITLHSFLHCQFEWWGRLCGDVEVSGSLKEYLCFCLSMDVCASVHFFTLCNGSSSKVSSLPRNSLGEQSSSWRGQWDEPIRDDWLCESWGERVRSGSGRRGTKEGIADFFMLPGRLLWNALKQLLS